MLYQPHMVRLTLNRVSAVYLTKYHENQVHLPCLQDTLANLIAILRISMMLTPFAEGLPECKTEYALMNTKPHPYLEAAGSLTSIPVCA